MERGDHAIENVRNQGADLAKHPAHDVRLFAPRERRAGLYATARKRK